MTKSTIKRSTQTCIKYQCWNFGSNMLGIRGIMRNSPMTIILLVVGLTRKIVLGMMTSSNGNIFRFTGPLCEEFTDPGEFPAQRPVTRSFDVFFDLHPNKRLSKQWWGWWFETQPCPLWRHRNGSLRKILSASAGAELRLRMSNINVIFNS